MPTPVQAQYQTLKQQNAEAILFFQLGDFYELFYEDARIGARVLGITLTARHKGTDNEMPMCGFPLRAHAEYLQALVDGGYRVAIADQVKHKDGTITREITRVVTPGTAVEASESSAGPRYLASVAQAGEQWAVAWVDPATGEFKTCVVRGQLALLGELLTLRPREVLLPKELYADESLCAGLPPTLVTPIEGIKTEVAHQLLAEHFGVQSLDGFGLEALGLTVRAAAQVTKYLQETQRTSLGHIRTLTPQLPQGALKLDHLTLQHLEVFHPLRHGEKDGTLVSVFAKSGSRMGARQLRQWLARPLVDRGEIAARQEAVRQLVEHPTVLSELREHLRNVKDLQRLTGRVCLGRANPREVLSLGQSVLQVPVMGPLLATLPEWEGELELPSQLGQIATEITTNLHEAPPTEITQGGIWQRGYDGALDEALTLSQEAERWLEGYVARCKEATGIATLRVKVSKTFGYCLEVSKGQIDKVPADWSRRQTLVNAERYTTEELSAFEVESVSAHERAVAREHQLYVELRERLAGMVGPLQQMAGALARIDALATLAQTALDADWCCPRVTDEVGQIEIVAGRHPVVEHLSTERFVANDLRTDHETRRLHLITGPNMAGKSTYLRQNAIIVILAQMGSYVPAKAATIGVCDQIFTRVGASDHLASGQSTFYTEMAETARILRTATERSFVILDEIGRGTSTFDGIALAWAITEYLHDEVKCVTLFATHYHELITLGGDLSGGINCHVAVDQTAGGMVFLRKIKPGGIRDSLGIEVAELAGVPATVVANATTVLRRLESESLLSGGPNLFSSFVTSQAPAAADPHPAMARLGTVQPDALTPREAHALLYELRELL